MIAAGAAAGEPGGAAAPARHAWTLWAVAASCALHVAEEALTGWRAWAKDELGIDLGLGPFLAAPGVVTSVLLYLPFSTWAFVGARRDGVSARALAAGPALGALLMLGVLLAARVASGG